MFDVMLRAQLPVPWQFKDFDEVFVTIRLYTITFSHLYHPGTLVSPMYWGERLDAVGLSYKVVLQLCEDNASN